MYEPILICLCELHLFVILQVVIPKLYLIFLMFFLVLLFLASLTALLSRRIYKYHKKIFSGGAIWLYNSQPSRNWLAVVETGALRIDVQLTLAMHLDGFRNPCKFA
ncbi:hypothetical protein V2W45_1388385 [Cenococcum geophilum]